VTALGGPGSQFAVLIRGRWLFTAMGFRVGKFRFVDGRDESGKGSLLLGNLSAGQRAVITDVGMRLSFSAPARSAIARRLWSGTEWNRTGTNRLLRVLLQWKLWGSLGGQRNPVSLCGRAVTNVLDADITHP